MLQLPSPCNHVLVSLVKMEARALNKGKDIIVSVQTSLQGTSVKQKYQVPSNIDSTVGGEIKVGREGWVHKREGRGRH